MDGPDVPPKYPRTEAESIFTPILRQIGEHIPGIVGVVLVDEEGETVDYSAESIDPYELKVAAAQWRIILQQVQQGVLPAHAGDIHRLVIENELYIYVIEALADGYALLSIVPPNAILSFDNRAIDAYVRALFAEAGWSRPSNRFPWFDVKVIVKRERPEAIYTGNQWVQVSVIGQVARGLQTGEFGYRIFVGSAGCEATLVFGLDKSWYLDIAPQSVQQEAVAK